MMIVSNFSPGSGQITVWFRDVVVVVYGALCGGGAESTASDAPF
jgi:hypothetical protein